jgi:hypothetical protein
MIGQTLSEYVSSVTAHATDTGDNSPSSKIHSVQKVSKASFATTNHLNLVRDCEKPVPYAQLRTTVSK